MIKNNSKLENKVLKKIKKVALIIFLVIFLPLISLIIYGVIAEAIVKNDDKNKFRELDTEMSSIYNKLVSVSEGVDEWNYEKKCDYTSIFALWSANYICETNISMQQPVVSVDEVIIMNEKYTDILKNNKNLIPISGHGPTLLPNTFETGGYIGTFRHTINGITCDFNSTLLEKKMINDINDLLWPESLPDNENGLVYFSFRCSGDTVDDWYEAM